MALMFYMLKTISKKCTFFRYNCPVTNNYTEYTV